MLLSYTLTETTIWWGRDKRHCYFWPLGSSLSLYLWHSESGSLIFLGISSLVSRRYAPAAFELTISFLRGLMTPNLTELEI